MRVHFSAEAWADYRHFLQSDPAILGRVNTLIEDVARSPFTGIGKPEPLRGALSGWWSRRISGEHRLVYRVEGKPGTDQRIEILACRYHYGR